MATWHICLRRYLLHNFGQQTKRSLRQQGAEISARTTVAILGGNSVVGRALEALLQGVGYNTRLIEDPPVGDPEELLGGVKLLLLAPSLSAESGGALLAVLGNALDAANIPVLTLSTSLREVLGDRSMFIPWPCRLEDLTNKIEASLLPVAEVGKAS